MGGQITYDQIMGFMIWLNLLESAHPNNPVPVNAMTDIIRGRNTKYQNLPRRETMMEISAIDKFGNVKLEAIQQSAVHWAYWKKKRKHLDELLRGVG